MPEYGLNIGSRRSVNVITPTFDRDFVTYGTLNHGTGPNITFTRASSATVFTSTGILSTVPDNVPRFEWGSFRTNYIRNSTMAGAVVGVIGAGGAWPSSGWNNSNSVPGVSAEIVGTGTISGLNYIDIKFSGTNTGSTANIAVRFDATTQVAATSGQTWTGSVYLALVGGDFSGLTTPIAQLVERNSLGNLIDSSSTSISNINATLQRITVTRQFNQTTTAYGNFQVVPGTCNAGSSVNITLRFAAPQYELSSAATAFIPTTTSAVTTGVPLGLLIEESRTNLFTRSAEFSANPPWTINNLSVSSTNVITAPDGSYQASKLVENADVGSKQIWQTFSRALTGTPYTGSVYMKAGERQYAQILMYNDTDGTFGRANIKLTDGSLTSILGTASAVYVKDGWYRVFVTATPTFSSFSYNIFPATDYGVTSYTGDGTSGIYVWGAQLEQGSFPTSYIPTAGLSATRQADDARVSSINTSSFYNQDQGTIFMETQYLPYRFTSITSPGLWTLDTGAFAQGYGLFYAATTARLQLYTRNTGNTITYFDTSPFTTPELTRSAAVISPTFRNLFFNGIPVSPAVAGTNTTPYVFPPITTFRIGANYIAGNYLFNFFGGYIRKITYWPTRLSNNRLRTLTLSA